MKSICSSCPHVCKRLDINEDPEHLYFNQLSAEEVVGFFETALKAYRGLSLETASYSRSSGNQLAVLFRNKKLAAGTSLDETSFLFLCQACEVESKKIDFFARFIVPDDCSVLEQQTSELSRVVRAVIALLRKKERHLSVIANTHKG